MLRSVRIRASVNVAHEAAGKPCNWASTSPSLLHDVDELEDVLELEADSAEEDVDPETVGPGKAITVDVFAVPDLDFFATGADGTGL